MVTAIFFYIFLLFIFRTVATTICVHLGKDKDAVVLGWEVGLFLGWIGAITMQVISASPEKKLRDQEPPAGRRLTGKPAGCSRMPNLTRGFLGSCNNAYNRILRTS